jgi:hypothetical protein
MHRQGSPVGGWRVAQALASHSQPQPQQILPGQFQLGRTDPRRRRNSNKIVAAIRESAPAADYRVRHRRHGRTGEVCEP